MLILCYRELLGCLLVVVVDKVRHSWPTGAKHAYGCMPMNLQSLDIGALIMSPSESLFATALRSATYVITIPNQRGSIYVDLTPIWCAYEIYLAYKWGKTIYVGTFRSMSFGEASWLYMSVSWMSFRLHVLACDEQLYTYIYICICIGIGSVFIIHYTFTY